MKILIVDDSSLLRERIIRTLDTYNCFSVKEASNGKEAIRKFNTFEPDAVVLDISFPDESGITILQKIKYLNPKVVVMMLTNYPTSQFKRICLQYGADYFYDKSKDLRNVAEQLQLLNDKLTGVA